MEHVRALAAALGIARIWHDVGGAEQVVSDANLARIAAALGYPAGDQAEAARSLAQVEEERREPPALIVCEAGKPVPVPASLTCAELIAEDGTARPVMAEGAMLAPIRTPGYYRLVIGGRELTLAIAPRACPGVRDLAPHSVWGPAVQIPALRGRAHRPFGNFAELAEAVTLFAARGADALAINPVHALFPGHGAGFSPYSPSSRLFLNGAMGDPALLGLPPLPEREGGALIDWENALPQRLADLRAVFDGLDEAQRARIAADNALEGAALVRHATFDALDMRFRPQGADGWHDWPRDFRDPAGKAVKRFAGQNPREVEFQMFVQWLAREGLAAVQRRARNTGMAVGLLTDVAVGVHPGGSDAWAMRDAMLDGLTIGAPPDPLGPHGQNWQLTGFSPRGLARSGFAPWIELVRAALASAGGLRIDHAFGLARLWVVPEGEASGAGAYLTYPFRDLVRLAALEAHRAGALVIAEDLGTMPPGFAEVIDEAGMLGMRVLWFERAADHGFIGAHDYAPASVAMTGTHDTATVAGWWSGRDLDWAERLDRLPTDSDRAQEEATRDWDRGLLWSTIGDGGTRPSPGEPSRAVEAALRHIGHSASQLAIAPLEDLLAEPEQPNLPGTVDGHPNWRRRLARPLGELLAGPETDARIAALADARREIGGPAG